MTFLPSDTGVPAAPPSSASLPRSPSIADVMMQAAEHTALTLRVCLPAKVTTVLGPQLVNVSPLLQQYVNGKAVNYPVITGVPVSMPIGGDFGLSYPLAVGDSGMIVCCDRSIDGFLASDGQTPVPPNSSRNHELTDAIFVPGLLAPSKQTKPTTDLRITNGRATLSVQKEGTFMLGNGQFELLDLVCRLASQLEDLAAEVSRLAPTTGWATPPVESGSIAITCGNIASWINTLKGG